MHKYLLDATAAIAGSASALTCIYFLFRPITFEPTHTECSELELVVRENFTRSSRPSINILLEQYFWFFHDPELVQHNDPFYTHELLRNIARQYNTQEDSSEIDTSYFTDIEKQELARELYSVTSDRSDIDTFLIWEDITDLLQLNVIPEPQPKQKIDFKRRIKQPNPFAIQVAKG